ncbi:hypothetical protein [Burkholderia lata]|uniref:hypothetical protein n=1 Tax=Burkholderia lata (strain ATCC 17760 / DSM 23089 / LMG 22485 / NCIMB 9086 / R18194 / 383) TaxID=482957 RepID=UPI0020C66BC5|nr:hypothetical protein [Burkholderia lata]
MMRLSLVAIATLALVSGSVHADALVNGTAHEQEAKQATVAADQLNPREQPQWLASGLQIVQPHEDCSAPVGQFSFATDINGKLMACPGPHSQWIDAEPILRIMHAASFSCGSGIPVC